MIDKAIADILARRRFQELTWAKSAEIGNNPSTSCTVRGAPRGLIVRRTGLVGLLASLFQNSSRFPCKTGRLREGSNPFYRL
jgi:hypothetical protein